MSRMSRAFSIATFDYQRLGDLCFTGESRACDRGSAGVPSSATWLQVDRHDILAYICKNIAKQSDLRRKFRSETSDNMDSWKSRGGKSQRGGKEVRRSEKKEDAGARKGRKVTIHWVQRVEK